MSMPETPTSLVFVRSLETNVAEQRALSELAEIVSRPPPGSVAHGATTAVAVPEVASCANRIPINVD